MAAGVTRPHAILTCQQCAGCRLVHVPVEEEVPNLQRILADAKAKVLQLEGVAARLQESVEAAKRFVAAGAGPAVENVLTVSLPLVPRPTCSRVKPNLMQQRGATRESSRASSRRRRPTGRPTLPTARAGPRSMNKSRSGTVSWPRVGAVRVMLEAINTLYLVVVRRGFVEQQPLARRRGRQSSGPAGRSTSRSLTPRTAAPSRPVASSAAVQA